MLTAIGRVRTAAPAQPAPPAGAAAERARR
jgi:hypothetical protein